jgi:hypothetical protein
MEFNIRAEGDRLYLADGLLPGEREFVEVSPGVFQRTDDPDNQLTFRFDENGRVEQLNLILYDTPMDFEPAQWYESNTVLLVLLIGPTLIFLLATIILPLIALYRRIKSRTYQRRQAVAHWLGWLLALLGTLMMGLFVLGDFSPLPFTSPYLNPTAVYAMLTLANVVFILALAVVVMWFTGLWQRYWGLFGSLGYTILGVGALLYIWFSFYNNLIGYQL